MSPVTTIANANERGLRPGSNCMEFTGISFWLRSGMKHRICYHFYRAACNADEVL